MRNTLSTLLFATLFITMVHGNLAMPNFTSNKVTITEQFLQQDQVLPVGTQLELTNNQEIKTKNFKGGDYFVMTVANDISLNGKIVIPKGTQAMLKVITSTSDGDKIIFSITLDGLMINNYLHKVRTENKSIALEKGSDSSMTIQLVGKSGQKAYLEEGSSIVFPKGNKSVFTLANDLEITW